MATTSGQTTGFSPSTVPAPPTQYPRLEVGVASGHITGVRYFMKITACFGLLLIPKIANLQTAKNVFFHLAIAKSLI